MWKFGQYLEKLLSEKGWSKNRLAKESGLSSGYLTWVVNGESSDKANPPNISLDTLLSLSKALRVHPMRLILAYQGQDPAQFDKEPDMEMDAMAEVFIDKLRGKLYERIEKEGGLQ